MSDPCPCDSGNEFGLCCEPLLNRTAQARTAEQLMRSRYSAFATGNLDYLRYSWHPATCPPDLELDPLQRWIGLKVIDVAAGGEDDTEGEVHFVARCKIAGKGHRLEERSHFQKVAGRWVYVGVVVGA